SEHAQAVQLAIEYAPMPPFDCGRPDLAPQAIVAAAMRRINSVRIERDAAIRRAAAALGGLS
ncbi:MAG: DJ-1/PfpI family protein, partial [Steroidobacteraceae bacterium]